MFSIICLDGVALLNGLFLIPNEFNFFLLLNFRKSFKNKFHTFSLEFRTKSDLYKFVIINEPLGQLRLIAKDVFTLRPFRLLF